MNNILFKTKVYQMLSYDYICLSDCIYRLEGQIGLVNIILATYVALLHTLVGRSADYPCLVNSQ